MSNNKQSSLEYFWKQLEEKGNAHIETEGVITVNITIDVNEYRLLQKQAKAMHKEEIIAARVDGDTWSTAYKEMRENYAEIYYNETFNTKEK